MKIFIITEGGENIGFGHLTRCISLYQAFEERGIMPEFVVNGNDSIENLLKDRNYQIFNWLEEKNRLFKLVQNSDIAIIDSYLADICLYQHLSEIVKIPVYIDDTKRLDYPRSIVVNGSIYAEKLEYPERDEMMYLLGTQYIPLRRAFWEVPEKEIKENMESVMITFGGDDSKNVTPKIIKLLKENYPMLRKNVIIGRAFKNIDEIKEVADKNTDLIYYPDAEKIKKIMLGSDIAISAGGQTLYEFARVRVPTMVIAVAGNQLNNIKGWQEAGYIEYAGRWDGRDVLENTLVCIEEIKDKDLRTNKSLIGKRFVDGRGSKRIVDFLLNALLGKGNLSGMYNQNFRIPLIKIRELNNKKRL